MTTLPNINKTADKQTLTKEQQMALKLQTPPASKIKGLGVGSFQAVIYGIWHVGLQENEYKGLKKINDTLIIGFETDERIEEEGDYKGKRKALSKRFTISAYEKANLMKFMKILLGDKCPTEKTFSDFDFESLIGINCILGITLTENGNDRIENISRLMKGMVELKAETPATPPKWVAELAEQGKMMQDSMNDNISNPLDEEMPF